MTVPIAAVVPYSHGETRRKGAYSQFTSVSMERKGLRHHCSAKPCPIRSYCRRTPPPGQGRRSLNDDANHLTRDGDLLDEDLPFEPAGNLGVGEGGLSQSFTIG